MECRPIYDTALARALDFANGAALPLTLFVVARDLNRAQNVDKLRRAVSLGHEIGNHSLDHLYDLTRQRPHEQSRQVAEANSQIHRLLGVKPVGFRAPGYTTSDALMVVLRELGFSYDSSVFSSPAYYAAKAAALLGMRLRRRESRSILDSLNVLRAPTVPYRVGEPYWIRGAGMLELPIQVVGPLRLPFIGTSVGILGPRAARLLTRGLTELPFVNLELHGVDFLDAAELPANLRSVQPDLRLSLSRKVNSLAAVLESLRSKGYTFLRLDEAARALSGTG